MGIKFTAGRYEVEYTSGQIGEVYLNKSQKRAFNQDLMEDLEIRSLRLKGQGTRNEWHKALKSIVVAFLLVLSLILCHAQDYTNEQIANAIYKAENSVKYPYGIKSIDTHGDKEYARKICLNTIRNNRKRFKAQTKYKDFIEFLGSRYCPISDYPRLNKNWVKNVKYFLEKDSKLVLRE